jgi:hypothetical protein
MEASRETGDRRDWGVIPLAGGFPTISPSVAGTTKPLRIINFHVRDLTASLRVATSFRRRAMFQPKAACLQGREVCEASNPLNVNETIPVFL